MSDPAFAAGFLTGFSLILAIGAQNAFVLRQGIRGEHVFAVCLACALSDALLIAAGVAGFSSLVRAAPWIDPVMRVGGVAFLLVYAVGRLRAAMAPAVLQAAGGPVAGLGRTLAVCLAFTFANPHVYLDTVVLLGSVSAGFPGRGTAFGAGAASASFVFFFTLGYGARLLAPVFASRAAWRYLDLAVAGMMALVAAGLLAGLQWPG